MDLFENKQWKNSNDSARYKKKIERDRVFVFLVGLNKELNEVRGRILWKKKPLQTIREVFSEVRREKVRRQVMLKNNDEQKIDGKGSTLMARGIDPGGKQKPWCDHCRKPWHTQESCWNCTGNQRKNQAMTLSQGEMYAHFKLAAQIQGNNHAQSLFLLPRNK